MRMTLRAKKTRKKNGRIKSSWFDKRKRWHELMGWDWGGAGGGPKEGAFPYEKHHMILEKKTAQIRCRTNVRNSVHYTNFHRKTAVYVRKSLEKGASATAGGVHGWSLQEFAGGVCRQSSAGTTSIQAGVPQGSSAAPSSSRVDLTWAEER